MISSPSWAVPLDDSGAGDLVRSLLLLLLPLPLANADVNADAEGCANRSLILRLVAAFSTRDFFFLLPQIFSATFAFCFVFVGSIVNDFATPNPTHYPPFEQRDWQATLPEPDPPAPSLKCCGRGPPGKSSVSPYTSLPLPPCTEKKKISLWVISR